MSVQRSVHLRVDVCTGTYCRRLRSLWTSVVCEVCGLLLSLWTYALTRIYKNPESRSAVCVFWFLSHWTRCVSLDTLCVTNYRLCAELLV